MDGYLHSGRALDPIPWRDPDRGAGPSAPMAAAGRALGCGGGLAVGSAAGRALRCAVTKSGSGAILLLLCASFPAHLFDLCRRRWQGRNRDRTAKPPDGGSSGAQALGRLTRLSGRRRPGAAGPHREPQRSRRGGLSGRKAQADAIVIDATGEQLAAAARSPYLAGSYCAQSTHFWPGCRSCLCTAAPCAGWPLRRRSAFSEQLCALGAAALPAWVPPPPPLLQPERTASPPVTLKAAAHDVVSSVCRGSWCIPLRALDASVASARHPPTPPVGLCSACRLRGGGGLAPVLISALRRCLHIQLRVLSTRPCCTAGAPAGADSFFRRGVEEMRSAAAQPLDLDGD